MQLRILILFFLLATSLSAQQIRRQGDAPPPAPPEVDQKAVDAAIRKGIEFLKTKADTLPRIDPKVENACRHHELVLWTFIHAGVPETDERFQKLLQYVLKEPLERTYLVSLQAMCLEEIQRVRYQMRIAQCAQFLADNQHENGSWGYGDPIVLPEHLDTPTPAGGVDTATNGGGKPREVGADGRPSKPVPLRKIPIRKNKKVAAEHDNSNAQYAALGIRACVDSGIVFEPVLLKKAKAWWETSQKGDGGWCYAFHPDKTHSYGSMTAGAISSLCVYRKLLNQPWQQDNRIKKGLEWLTRNFTVDHHPGEFELHAREKGENPMWVYYYYLYALERAGILYGTESFGPHAWYPIGAKKLLTLQAESGAWGDGSNPVDTCFSILFLRRATRPLDDVASGGGKKTEKK